jgi:PBSX family phage terminase large subunit
MPDRVIRISQIVGEPHLDNFNSRKLHQVDKGGRSSVKSSKNEVKIALRMIEDKTCEVAVVRQNHVDHRDTTFAGLKIGFERLGYPLRAKRDYPTGKSGSLYIRTPQENYVHFAGLNDPESIKGIRPTKLGNEIKILWLFEITQFRSEYDMNQVIATFLRGQKDYFMILYEYNPHPKTSHWTYAWVKKMMKRDDAYVQHTNYIDLPEWQQRDWIGELMLQEINMLKEIDYEQYKNIYLGLPANLVGTIYKKFDKNNPNHVGECGLQKYMKIDIGNDYGVVDATVFTARGTLAGFNGIEIPSTFYHKNCINVGSYLQEDYIDRFFEWVEKLHDRFPMGMTIWVDSANKDFKDTIEREIVRRNVWYLAMGDLNKLKRLDKVQTKRGEIRKKDISAIQGRINLMNRMLGVDFIKIDPICVELIKAIEEAEYDKWNDRLDDGTVDVDSLDSLEYSWLDDMDIIDDKIYMKRGVINGAKQKQARGYTIGNF